MCCPANACTVEGDREGTLLALWLSAKNFHERCQTRSKPQQVGHLARIATSDGGDVVEISWYLEDSKLGVGKTAKKVSRC